MNELLLELLDYVLGLAVRAVGVETAKQTVAERFEILAGRSAADAEAAAKFGEVPPP